MTTINTTRDELVERVATLFDAIQHGDGEHQVWLKEAIDAHFAGRDIPAPRGSGNKESLIESLLAQHTENAKRIEELALAFDEIAVALMQCRDKFLHYEDLHRLKCTPEGDEKADRNRDMSEMIQASLDKAMPARIAALNKGSK